MKKSYYSSYSKQEKSKVVVYAVVLAVVLALGAVVVQDIDVPTEKISQTVEVNLEK